MTPEEYKKATTIPHVMDHGDTKVAFVYVPKTGGTFLSINPIPYKFHGEKYRPSRLPSEMHMPASRVMGIVDSSTPFFTILRDPYDRLCSEYFFIKEKAKASIDHFALDIGDPNKIDFIARKSSQIMKASIYYDKAHAIYTHNMSVEDYLEWSIDHPTYSFYYDSKTPKDFDVVGITDSLRETSELLNKMYGMTSGNGSYNNNVNKNINSSYKTDYSRNHFKKISNIEYGLYDEGRAVFEKLCRQYL